MLSGGRNYVKYTKSERERGTIVLWVTCKMLTEKEGKKQSQAKVDRRLNQMRRRS